MVLMKIFNYSTFSTRLEKSTRTLYLSFHTSGDQGTLETLFEFESLLNWAKARVEIHSLFISCEGQSFDLAFSKQGISKLKPTYLEKVFQKISLLTKNLMDLPQTVIWDLGGTPSSLVFQLSLGADIRLAPENTIIKTNDIDYGLFLCPDVLALGQELFGQSISKRLLTGRPFNSQQLSQWGVLETYALETREEFFREHLNYIHNQAPIVRIQVKLAQTQIMKKAIAEYQNIEKTAYQAANLIQDWKNFQVDGHSDYTPAQHVKYIMDFLKKSHEQEKMSSELSS